MKNILFTLLLIVNGCTQDPKSKLYNNETLQKDLLEFSEEEKVLLMNYIISDMSVGRYDDTNELVDLKTKTYGEIISSQLKYEQKLDRQIDSLLNTIRD